MLPSFSRHIVCYQTVTFEPMHKSYNLYNTLSECNTTLYSRVLFPCNLRSQNKPIRLLTLNYASTKYTMTKYAAQSGCFCFVRISPQIHYLENVRFPPNMTNLLVFDRRRSSPKFFFPFSTARAAHSFLVNRCRWLKRVDRRT